MRTGKPDSPPPYDETGDGVAQERTPLLPPRPPAGNNHATPGRYEPAVRYDTRYQSQYTSYPYSHSHSRSSSSSTSTAPQYPYQNRSPYQNQNPPPLFPRQLRIPRRQRSGLGNKACRFILLSLLGLSIVGIVFKSWFLFLPFNSTPGIKIPSKGEEAKTRVAIIGAGAAGVGAAVGLSEGGKIVNGKGKGVEVVVFERGDRVGGRMGGGFDLDSGSGSGIGGWTGEGTRIGIEDVASAELFSDEQSVVRRRVERVLGLSFTTVDTQSEALLQVGFLASSGMQITITRPGDKMSWTQWAQQLFKYGSSFLSARNLGSETVVKFKNMLNLVDTQTFNTMEDWVSKAGLGDTVSAGARDKLKNAGVSDTYRMEVIEAQMMRQLGQSTEEISELALGIALSRERGRGSSSRSGTWDLETMFSKMLDKSGVEVRLGSTLRSLSSERVGGKHVGWRLEVKGETRSESEVFDKVILTAPWGEGEGEWYRRVTTTFVLSTAGLNAEFFNMAADSLPEQMLPIPGSEGLWSDGIHEISFVKNIFGPDADLVLDVDTEFGTESVRKLYKILSLDPVSEDVIKEMFGEGDVKTFVKEDRTAYPLLFPREGSELRTGKFKVRDDGVWSTAVVERVGMGVDLSWAAGENVAALVLRDIDEAEAKAKTKLLVSVSEADDVSSLKPEPGVFIAT